MSDQVYCQFKHISSTTDGQQLAKNIETFVKPKVFNEKGIQNCGKGGNDSIEFTLTRAEANRVRDRLGQVLPNESSPIWFHIQSDPLNGLDTRSIQSTDDPRHEGSIFRVTCQFGSLQSYNRFYYHVPLNNQLVDVTFRPARPSPNSLNVEFDDYRLVIPFDAIQKKNILVNKQTKSNGVFILIPLKYTPKVFRLVPNKFDDKTNKKFDKKQERICADDTNKELLKDIEYCSDLVLHFKESQNMAWAFIRHLLGDRSYRYHINFSNFQILDWSKEIINLQQRPDPFDYRNASYQDRYALDMLTSLGFVFRDKWAQLTDKELEWNTWNINDRYNLCCFAVEQLYEDHGYDLRQTKRDYEEKRRKEKKSAGNVEQQVANAQLLKVAVCTLTPLRTIIRPLEVTVGSRALRHNKLGGPEKFLLVHFREEDNDRLNVTSKTIKERLKNSMLHGIELLRRKFIYMGSSTGQMKERAFWFIDLPPNLKNITEAHKLFGNFDGIKNIATYIARVGQYFSRTWPIDIKLTEVKTVDDIRQNNGINYVTQIPDIERGSYCFTDGIGRISWGLAGRIAQKMDLPLSSKKDIPSAYQVRVAGCKGMVSIDPNSTLNDYYILVRKSMIKFPSNDWGLEICDYARPIPLTLNNQVIRLLSDLGNPDGAFIALQNQSLTHLEIPEEQQLNGIEIAAEKSLSYASSKDNLLTNRIPIPLIDGRNMFGVADETGELQYGECFIQCSSFGRKSSVREKMQVITGTIIVTKNPCLWPGDFRRLKAVPNTKLEACMRDVIVFPTNGKRPHSNEISGSDLDGDQYWVYWGDSFKIRPDQDIEPLSYKGAKKEELPSFDKSKIIEHIVQSFESGIILGMIANTHTVVADKHPDHSFSEPCKQLAELFALAVDSPKTGKFIEKEQIRPYQKKYCDTYPKFMRRFGEPSSESKSILETLYLKAKSVYEDPDIKIEVNTVTQRKKCAPVIAIEGKAFEKWLQGEIYEESPARTKPPRKQKPTESDDDESESDDETTPPPKSIKVTTDDNSTKGTKPRAKKSSLDISKSPEPSVISKPPTNENPPKKPKKSEKKSSEEPSVSNKEESSDTKKSIEIVNTAGPTSGASSLASSSLSLASLNTDQCYLDFQMISDPAITAAGNVEFPEAGRNLHIARPRNEIREIPDRDLITSKLITYMEKLDVFKKDSPASNIKLHGSLYLVIFYGHIYFSKQDPQKLDALRKSIAEKCEQIPQFRYAHLDEFDIEDTLTKKNKFDYELNCRLDSSSEYITLLFDKNKTLEQIRVNRVWLKSFIRLPNYTVDNLYEMRSVIIHDSGSSEFETISNEVFKTKSKDILTGRKPNITINRELLRSSVIPISLKIIEEDKPTHINQPGIDAFHRKVKYISINERQDKPTVSSTLEYHVTPIKKPKDVLIEIFDFALSPIEKHAPSEKPTRSSNASSMSSLVRGFSMSDV